MKKEIIGAIITAVIGLIGAYTIHNEQNLTVNINGKDASEADIQRTTSPSKNESQELQVNIDSSEYTIEKEQANVVTQEKNVDYLIYKLEPYSKSRYRKVTDASMTIAGVTYNNGFELYTCYSDSYCIFNLGGKYSVISGIIGCDDSNYSNKIPVEFWGDDVLLDTIVLHKNDLAQDFSVNLSEVSKFEIKIPYANGSSVDFAEVKIN